MAILKSEFSLGNGRLKEVAGLTYDDSTAALATGASSILALGAATTANASFIAGNDKLASKGYVDAAIDAVVPGIPGDATFLDIAVPSAATFTAGNLVAFNASGVLALADANGEASSNLIGAFLEKPTPTTARVQVDGEVVLSTDLAAFTNGDLLFVAAAAGAATSYGALLSGEYATQVGIVSKVGDDKVVLQQRIFGQVG
jgi:hypothetical protein